LLLWLFLFVCVSPSSFSLQQPTLVAFNDPNVALLIVNSHVPHGLGDGQYEVRVKQCAEAVGVLRLRWPSITKLRDASIEQLNAVEAMMDETAFYRARHVITENERTQQAAQLLSAGNYNMLGKLMTFSHVSMKNDYEISVDNIDALVDAALELPGVYGSRLTGGGFGGQKGSTNKQQQERVRKKEHAVRCASSFFFWWGQLSSRRSCCFCSRLFFLAGCTVTLVQASEVEKVAEAIVVEYKEQYGIEASTLITRPGPGVQIVKL